MEGESRSEGGRGREREGESVTASESGRESNEAIVARARTEERGSRGLVSVTPVPEVFIEAGGRQEGGSRRVVESRTMI
jgi:hypothetical protein